LGLMGLSMSNGSGSPAMVVGVWVGVDSSIHRQRRGGSLARLNVNFNLGRPRRIDDRIDARFFGENGQFYGRCDSRKRVYFVLLFVSREFAVFVWRRGKKAFTASKVIPASASTPRTLSSDTAHSRCKRGTGARRVHPRLVASRIQSHQCRAHEIPPFP